MPLPGPAAPAHERLGKVIPIEQAQLKDRLGTVARKSVEHTLNGMLDAEADRLGQAERYERGDERASTRAGHYERKLHTKAGEATQRVDLGALAAGEDGFRQVFGALEGAKDDKVSRSALVKHLEERGLKGVQLAIRDKCLGSADPIAEVVPSARRWERLPMAVPP